MKVMYQHKQENHNRILKCNFLSLAFFRMLRMIKWKVIAQLLSNFSCIFFIVKYIIWTNIFWPSIKISPFFGKFCVPEKAWKCPTKWNCCNFWSMFRINLILVRIMHYYMVSLHAMFGDVEICPLKIIICSVSGPN